MKIYESGFNDLKEIEEIENIDSMMIKEKMVLNIYLFKSVL